DLPPQDLPDGSGNIDAVRGTEVTLKAAADRPLVRAWIEYQPEPRHLSGTAALLPLAAPDAAPLLGATAGGREGWGPGPAEIGRDPRQFRVRFSPCVSGHYALHLEDDIGLSSTRYFELRVQNDPAPEVKMQRPSASRDVLSVLPAASLPLDVVASDPRFA